MAELGGTVTYLYWSQRRADQFLNDNGIELPSVTKTIATPGFHGIPFLSRTVTRQGGLRPQMANAIESALGQSAVTRFDSPAPIRFAKGLGGVVFGEFITWVRDEPQQAVIFAAADYDAADRDSVAVCLFGSLDNFAGRIQSAGPGFTSGWSSSNAPEVFRFLQSRCPPTDGRRGSAFLASEALSIALGQGASSHYTGNGDFPEGLDRPWRRAFTYGDVQNAAEWLAEIYLDVDVDGDLISKGYCSRDITRFRRILIGAPFWIRTPSPRALRLYGEEPPEGYRG